MDEAIGEESARVVTIAARPKRRVADDTRRRLLDAGRTRFSTHGFSATSITEILRDSKVTSPVLYHHFGSKQGLFVAIAREVYEEFIGELRAALEQSTEFYVGLNDMLDAAVTINQRDPSLAMMTFTVQQEVHRHPELFPELHEPIREFRLLIDELVVRARPFLSEPLHERDLSIGLIAIVNGLSGVAAGSRAPYELASAVRGAKFLIAGAMPAGTKPPASI